MLARVWGCRGSIAAPGEATVRYGGNTSCVEVRLESGHVLVLDAGTGMRPLGTALGAATPTELHILLTHLHLDHLQGLGFFLPLFQPGVDVHIWGPPSPVQTLAERIAIYLSPPLFPVRLSDVRGERHLPRCRRERRHDRLGGDPGRPCHAPGPDGRIPHRGGRAGRSPTSPTTSRPSEGPSPAQPTLDERLRHRARRRRAVPRRAVPRRGVSGTRRLGAQRHRPRARVRAARRGWAAWCSSTTTRITPMPTSRPCSTPPAARSMPRTTGCRLAYEGMSVEFDETGVCFAERGR